MFFQNFTKFDIWDSIESSIYYIAIGYYVLIFFYFILMRFRTSKKAYWFYFSWLFLCLAVGRFFFIIYYFYAPELEGTMTNPELVSLLMVLYRLATFSTWLGIACLMAGCGENRSRRIFAAWEPTTRGQHPHWCPPGPSGPYGKPHGCNQIARGGNGAHHSRKIISNAFFDK